MSDEPLSNRQRIGMLIKRDLPDRSGPSKGCGMHPPERTRLIARTCWVCLDCVREQSQ
ncbi:hypothetical protein HMPREF1486_01896 [Streptomyces sp. HPH0547]|nr:hypothetical protein HMPREF1486_01896 [Streptomyces sp. HPH0547]GHJ21776.1 hypothetical protein TPA0909_33900 [Streptomyces albus]